MHGSLDDHWQPLNTFWNHARRRDRTIHEMLGLVKGVIVDGEVTDGEAQFLAHWINCNPEAVSCWPGDVLAERLRRIFTDGRVTADEREDLLFFLQDLSGQDPSRSDVGNPSTRLPIDDPLPTLSFDGGMYVFTGRFIYGTRAQCQAAVLARGATCGSTITKKTNVLVIGDVGSRDWAHTSFGRKIRRP